MSSKKKVSSSKKPAARKRSKKTARKVTTARANRATKKTARRKTVRKKAPARKKAAAIRGGKAATGARATPKKSGSKASRSRLTIDELSAGAQRLMLANLGLYGTVLDELQKQLSRAKATVQKARKDPDAANRQLVARGERLLGQVSDLIQKSGAPATKQLNEQIAEFRDALTKLRKKLPRG